MFLTGKEQDGKLNLFANQFFPPFHLPGYCVALNFWRRFHIVSYFGYAFSEQLNIQFTPNLSVHDPK